MKKLSIVLLGLASSPVLLIVGIVVVYIDFSNDTNLDDFVAAQITDLQFLAGVVTGRIVSSN